MKPKERRVTRRAPTRVPQSVNKTRPLQGVKGFQVQREKAGRKKKKKIGKEGSEGTEEKGQTKKETKRETGGAAGKDEDATGRQRTKTMMIRKEPKSLASEAMITKVPPSRKSLTLTLVSSRTGKNFSRRLCYQWMRVGK